MIFRYDDLSRFEGDWWDAPGYGVQTIAYLDPATGPELRHQGDYYRMDNDGAVIGMDYNSLIHWLVDDLRIVKVGSMVGPHQWKRVYQLGKQDRDSLRGNG